MKSNQTVIELLGEFYKEKNFTDDAQSAKWIHVKMGSLKIPFPNFKQRREVIQLHDLTHILTGYDTPWKGEGETAAWELASGFSSKYWIGYVYAPITFSIGLIISPIRTLRAFRKGLGKNNVYKLPNSLSKILEMKVSDLKKTLDV